ncbi:hypothetical protein DdX_03588 [Ditylenchus destructor]|uniref:Tudor domain-containing protein n=1 Tax=Ditylenchus destructor TaxID=166010 RepID=A0AAD4R4Y4_9BILA|nr:hypothetical protein DdX_03588 [Ditylenchus destructor]
MSDDMQIAKDQVNVGGDNDWCDTAEKTWGPPRVQYEPIWNVGDRVLCRWRATRYYYQATIRKVIQYVDQPLYVVHYMNYKTNAGDLQLSQIDALECFLPLTVANKKKAAEMVARGLAKVKPKKTLSAKRPARGSAKIAKENTPVSKKRQRASNITARSDNDHGEYLDKSSSDSEQEEHYNTGENQGSSVVNFTFDENALSNISPVFRLMIALLYCYSRK